MLREKWKNAAHILTQAVKDGKDLDGADLARNTGLAFVAVAVQTTATSLGATGLLVRDMFFGRKAGVESPTTQPRP